MSIEACDLAGMLTVPSAVGVHLTAEVNKCVPRTELVGPDTQALLKRRRYRLAQAIDAVRHHVQTADVLPDWVDRELAADIERLLDHDTLVLSIEAEAIVDQLVSRAAEAEAKPAVKKWSERISVPSKCDYCKQLRPLRLFNNGSFAGQAVFLCSSTCAELYRHEKIKKSVSHDN